MLLDGIYSHIYVCSVQLNSYLTLVKTYKFCMWQPQPHDWYARVTVRLTKPFEECSTTYDVKYTYHIRI